MMSTFTYDMSLKINFGYTHKTKIITSSERARTKEDYYFMRGAKNDVKIDIIAKKYIPI